jgi:hypothetical protein
MLISSYGFKAGNSSLAEKTLFDSACRSKIISKGALHILMVHQPRLSPIADSLQRRRERGINNLPRCTQYAHCLKICFKKIHFERGKNVGSVHTL